MEQNGLIDTSVLHQVADLQDFECEKIILCKLADILNSKGKTTSKAIIFTELNLHVFKKRSMFRKTHVIGHSYPWHKLVSISVPEQKSFILTFPEIMIRIIDQDPALYIDAIVSHLRDVRIAGDMPQLLFDHSILKPSITTQVTQKGLMEKRLRFQAFALEKNLPPAFYSTFNQYIARISLLEEKDAVFDFRNLFSYPQSFDVILYALIGEKNIKSIIIPQSQFKNWASLGKLMKYNNYITEIETMEQPDETTKSFVDSLISNKNTQLKSLRFRRSTYDQNFVSYLTSLIQHIPKLVDLAIEDSLSPQGLTAFIDNFETCAEYGRIAVLSLRETTGIDIARLISLAPNLRSLDLCRCDIDISTIISEFQQCELEVLNLSENKSDAPLSPDIKISPTLNKILASNVTWKGANFANFLTVISNAQSNSESGLYLDISNLKISDGEAKNAIEAMQKISLPNLTALVYNGNLVNSEFLSFLRNCNNLRSISVTDCFSSMNISYKNFLVMIRDSTTITELIIRSTKEPFSANMTKTLFDFLKLNKSIAILDFQDQHQGMPLFCLIKDFIETNMTIREIRFDNNSLPSMKVLQGLAYIAEKRNKPLKLHIPKHDVLDLAYTAKLSEAMLGKQLQMIKRIGRNADVATSGEQFDFDEFVPSIPSSHRKTLPAVNLEKRISDDLEDLGSNMMSLGKKRKDSCAETYDFSEVKKKFVDDDNWCESLRCVPIRDTEQYVNNINNDLSIEAIIALVISQQ
ncbi:hypothetical protein TRFO_18754 [Tritrichomonas foetus]|uniref:Leucine Rich Repeat family protein n=1 Tax=Tritrichomonas foetus TaxID=1144522 RepID=A0A1J4KQN1_9EUKA|nr:hypothetical protein TRFO_18754 [Tritrichomonas foetus]|eukprot:OHT11765.1 hypothetical protein TRFO_18754 [Tritrichomonas foetus]